MLSNYIHLFIIAIVIRSIKCFIDPSIDSTVDYKVAFLSVIFRHGDRTPEELYPNDPHINYDFDSVGFGSLTLAGKARAYELGTHLRYFYKDFLGGVYMNWMVMGRSTDYARTKMSLMLVLSALYPPRDKQIWNPILNWQPIPINYVSREKDFLTAIQSCPLYIEEVMKVQNSEEVEVQIERFRPLMINLTQWTGKNINSSTDLLLLYHTLMAEYSMGLELPEWAHDIFPKGQLLEATIFRLQILNYNTELRSLFSGVLLKNIVDNMNGIANGTINDGRRIHLFSGHDTNIASLLMTLGVFEPHLPEYSSAVIVELLQSHNGQYYVGIRYYFGIPPETKVLSIPKCDMNPCPLKKFIHLMTDVMSTARCYH